MASLWEGIDDYLIAQLDAEMGADGIYGTYQLKRVFFDDMLSLEQSVLIDEFPIALIRSLDASASVSEHGNLASSGKLLLENEYEYRIITLAQVDGREECREIGQEMRRRVLTFLAKRRAFGGLSAADGEHVTRIVLGESTLDMWSRSNDDDAVWYAIVEVNFTVLTKG